MMFAATRVVSGFSRTDFASVPLLLPAFPRRELKVQQIPNPSPTSRVVMAALSRDSSDNMAVNANATEEGNAGSKWSGGVDLVLECDLDAAWTLQSDFLGLTKWVPTISICSLVEGEPNAVGCLRYCKGTGTTWVHERLLEIDDARHYMSYRMEDNHFVFPQGFQGYVAKVQLLEAGEGKTRVKWTYEVDPVVTQTREQLTEFMIGFYTGNLKFLETGANKLTTESGSKDAVSKSDL